MFESAAPKYKFGGAGGSNENVSEKKETLRKTFQPNKIKNLFIIIILLVLNVLAYLIMMALLGFLSNLSRLFLSGRSGDASVAEDEGGAEVGVGHDQQVL
jgi:hypothetical protein